MPTLENLTLADLQNVMKAKSLNKAQGYLDRMRNMTRSGQTLTAQVIGTRPYEVEIDVGESGIAARCTCPYTWGGFCKHIGGVLLKWIESPNSFAVIEAPPALDGYPIPVTPAQPPPTHKPTERPFWLAVSSADRSPSQPQYDDEEYTPRLAASLADRQRADREQIETWLSIMKLQDLRRMAQERGWQVKGTAKAEIIRQVVDHIVSPDAILKAVTSLDGEHRQVLRAMLLLANEEGSQLEDMERLAASWGELKTYKQISTYTRHLCGLGLAVPGEVISAYPPRLDFVPRAMRRHLPPLLEGVIPATADLRSDHPASDLRFADAYELVRALSQITLLLEQSSSPLRSPMPRPRLERFYPGLEAWDYDPYELQRLEQGGKFQPYSESTLSVPPPAYSLPDNVIERLAPVAGGEARLEFVYSLAVATGLLQPGSPVTVWSGVKEQFLRRDELAQRAILARVYFWMQNWSELWDLLRGELVGQFVLRRAWQFAYLKPAHLYADLARFRRLILGALASLPDDKWVMLDDLLPLVRRIWTRFDGTSGRMGWHSPTLKPWFLAGAGSDKPLGPAGWESVQSGFIRYIMAGPLHWLGLADLSFEGGELAAVRFHGLAALFWDRVDSPPAPRHNVAQTAALAPEEAVTIHDDAISVNPSAISAQAHSLLDRFARLEVAAADRFVYRVDPYAAYQTFEAGLALSEILNGWDRLLAVPMPEVIRARLAEWWNAYGRVRIYQNVTIVEFGDEFALAEMKAVTSLDKVIIAEISPRLVLIPEGAVDSLAAELERAGYTPKQTNLA